MPAPVEKPDKKGRKKKAAAETAAARAAALAEPLNESWYNLITSQLDTQYMVSSCGAVHIENLRYLQRITYN